MSIEDRYRITTEKERASQWNPCNSLYYFFYFACRDLGLVQSHGLAQSLFFLDSGQASD